MNEIKVFQNTEFGEVRTVIIGVEPWFVAKDIAIILGYKNTNQSVKDNTNEKDRRVSPVMTPSGTQGMVVVNESGMYDLIFGSHLPSSKDFRHWVTSDVLPTLRKTGKYSVQTNTPSYMIDNPAERARAWALEYEEKQRLEQTIEEQRPGQLYYEKCTEKKVNTNFRDTAKILDMSQTQLTGWLKELGYVYEAKDKALLPYEPYVKSGLFVVKDYVNPYGYSGRQGYVTPKGKAHLQLLLELEEIEPRKKNKHGGRKRK